jgi:GR25 family glycosyltransferase involved in LPS biosynthesis
LNIVPERFRAVYGKDLPKDSVQQLVYPSVDYTIRKGRSLDSQFQSMNGIGCYLSHLNLWKQLLEDPENDMYIIFEDDTRANSTINDIREFLDEVDEFDWDFLFLGFFKPFFTQVDTKIRENVYKINSQTFGLHAYIINKQGARKLVDNAIPIVDQLDSYISYMAMERGFNAYRPKSSLFYQDNPKSSIQTDRGNVKVLLNRLDSDMIIYILVIYLVVVFLFFALLKSRKCT